MRDIERLGKAAETESLPSGLCEVLDEEVSVRILRKHIDTQRTRRLVQVDVLAVSLRAPHVRAVGLAECSARPELNLDRLGRNRALKRHRLLCGLRSRWERGRWRNNSRHGAFIRRDGSRGRLVNARAVRGEGRPTAVAAATDRIDGEGPSNLSDDMLHGEQRETEMCRDAFRTHWRSDELVDNLVRDRIPLRARNPETIVPRGKAPEAPAFLAKAGGLDLKKRAACDEPPALLDGEGKTRHRSSPWQ